MSAIIRDLKAAGKDISEGEQVLSAIQAIPGELEHWGNVKLVSTHSKHLKTFSKIQSHLELDVDFMF